jgi:hypothetical protein
VGQDGADVFFDLGQDFLLLGGQVYEGDGGAASAAGPGASTVLHAGQVREASSFSPQAHIQPVCRAGLPMTRAWSVTSLVTTAPGVFTNSDVLIYFRSLMNHGNFPHAGIAPLFRLHPALFMGQLKPYGVGLDFSALSFKCLVQQKS